MPHNTTILNNDENTVTLDFLEPLPVTKFLLSINASFINIESTKKI